MARAFGVVGVGLLLCTLILSTLYFLPNGKHRRKALEIVSRTNYRSDVVASSTPLNIDYTGTAPGKQRGGGLQAVRGEAGRRIGSSTSTRIGSVGLSDYGESLRTVMVSAVWLDGVCRSFGTDWRADLPRFLAKMLQNATVLVNKRPLPQGVNARYCNVCRNDVESSGSSEDEKFLCMDWLHVMGNKHVDAMIMFGSGPPWCAFKKNPRPNGPCRRSHPQLHAATEDPWVGPNTRVYHFPTDWRLGKPDGVPIDQIVWENSFPKPSNLAEELIGTGETLESWREICTNVPKQNVLLYIARMLDWKGQKDFLNRISPRLIKGYTVEFIAKPAPNATEIQELLSLAKARGIDVRVRPGAVSEQLELLSLLCRAKGLVHYARKDANPRVIYQAAAAGTPALVTFESEIPERVQQHGEVVTMTNFTAGSARLNADFSRFIQNVEHPNAAQRAMQYAMTELEPEKVWTAVCQQMGICA